MRRLHKLMTVSAAALAPAVFFGLKWGYSDSIKYPIPTCERHVLAYNGRPIVGVEDMAYDDVSGHVYMSAYDRRNTISGGVYSVNPRDLNDVRKLDLPDVKYPHGLDFSQNGDFNSLSVINRNFEDPKQSSARLHRFRWSKNAPQPAPTNTSVKEGFCNANDLTSLSNMDDLSYLITRDHHSCRNLSKSWENVSQPDSSDLVSFDFEMSRKVGVVKSKLYFANGITTLPDKNTGWPAVYVAETRKNRLSLFEQIQPNEFQLVKQIPLPGGPDNLTRAGTTDASGIWAALHPNLIKFTAFRAGWLPATQSRFAHIRPGKPIEVFDVPSDILSGATVALDVQGRIFLGAAYDEAIAICNIKDKFGDR